VVLGNTDVTFTWIARRESRN